MDLRRDEVVRPRAGARPTIHVLSDCRTVRAIATDDGRDDVEIRRVELGQLRAGGQRIRGCLVLDATDGAEAEVLALLRTLARRAPSIVLARPSDIRLAVTAVKAGAFDVLAKPVDPGEFWSAVRKAFNSETEAGAGPRAFGLPVVQGAAREAVSTLTQRQHDILARIVRGQPNKIIAADLGISQRTAENHRAAIMRKLGVSSTPALVQVALAASWSDN